MSIDEAITHCLEVADGQTEQGKCPECAEDHRQLAKWLTDYKRLKEREPKWIPVKWHEITDEERKENDYPKDWACYLDFKIPYDGQRILVTTKGGYVELDECYSDDGCTFSLDSGYDWIDDVIAWMPLPEPYEPQEGSGEV